MKAKLIKLSDNNYKLYVNEETFATTDNSPYKKLSLKNCRAIENGYDLDDLVKQYVHCKYWGTSRIEQAYADGFNKALKILGDKKFSEGDLKYNMYELLYLDKEDDEFYEVFRGRQFQFIDNKIKSLQQPKWDVEVITECLQCQEWGYVNGCNKKFLQPKLDKDNCLILKRL